MRKLTPIVLSGLLLFTAACGDDDGGGGGDLSSEDQEFVDAAMEEYDPEEAEPLTEDEARCIVESFAEAIPADRREELNITPALFGSDDAPFPQGLTEEEANGVVDGFDGCIDLGGIFLQGMAEDETLSDDAKECLADAFDDDTIRRLFVTMLTEGEEAIQQDSELMSEFMAIFSECPEALGGAGEDGATG